MRKKPEMRNRDDRQIYYREKTRGKYNNNYRRKKFLFLRRM